MVPILTRQSCDDRIRQQMTINGDDGSRKAQLDLHAII